jgi:peroxiredoxin
MKRVFPYVVTLLLAHVIGSYGALVPSILENALKLNEHGNWILVCFAPIFTPFLVLLTVMDFPHYLSDMPQAWAGYTIPFVIVCLFRRRKTPFVRLATLPVAITLLVTALWLRSAIAAPIPWHSPLETKPAPDFTLTALSGATCSISREKGHVILIDFWETNCPPCQAELKQTIAKLQGDTALHNQGLCVWTINIMDDADATRKFMDENHYDFPVILAPQNMIATLYPVDGTPTTYLIGRDGLIRKSFAGFDAATDLQLRMEIEAALK